MSVANLKKALNSILAVTFISASALALPPSDSEWMSWITQMRELNGRVPQPRNRELVKTLYGVRGFQELEELNRLYWSLDTNGRQEVDKIFQSSSDGLGTRMLNARNAAAMAALKQFGYMGSRPVKIVQQGAVDHIIDQGQLTISPYKVKKEYRASQGRVRGKYIEMEFEGSNDPEAGFALRNGNVIPHYRTVLESGLYELADLQNSRLTLVAAQETYSQSTPVILRMGGLKKPLTIDLSTGLLVQNTTGDAYQGYEVDLKPKDFLRPLNPIRSCSAIF